MTYLKYTMPNYTNLNKLAMQVDKKNYLSVLFLGVKIFTILLLTSLAPFVAFFIFKLLIKLLEA